MPLPDKAEIALAGRSNAGKSSLLNALAGRKNMAKTSSSPGHTRLLNFYDLEQGGRLVDLPGYGYASVSKADRKRWRRLMEGYLAVRNSLLGVVLVVDCRHPLKESDRDFIEMVVAHRVRLLVALNKIDKLNQSARAKNLRTFEEDLAGYTQVSMHAVSALKRTGLQEILTSLQGWFAEVA